MTRRPMSPAEQARRYRKLAVRWTWITITLAVISLTVTLLAMIFAEPSHWHTNHNNYTENTP